MGPMDDPTRLENQPGIMDKILEKIEGITTAAKPAPTDFWNSNVEHVVYFGPTRPAAPVFRKTNDHGRDLALRRLDIILDTPRPTTYITAYIAGVPVFETTQGSGQPENDSRQTPFHAVDVSLDFKQGVRVPVGRALEVYIHDTTLAGPGTGGSIANIFAAFGGI